MPEAIVVSIAKAVTQELAAAALSKEIHPERSYADWSQPLEREQVSDEERLYVDVVPQATGLQVGLETRGTTEHRIVVDIAVRQRFSQDKQDRDTGRVVIDEVDRLMLLVEEIYELFMPQRLTEFEDAVWDPEQGTRILVAPLKRHLYEMKQFTGIVRLTFIASQDHG